MTKNTCSSNKKNGSGHIAPRLKLPCDLPGIIMRKFLTLLLHMLIAMYLLYFGKRSSIILVTSIVIQKISIILWLCTNLIVIRLQANEVWLCIQKVESSSSLQDVSMHLLSSSQLQSSAALSWYRSTAIVSTTLQPHFVACCLILKFTACATSSCSSWCNRCHQTVLVSCWDSLSHCTNSCARQA